MKRSLALLFLVVLALSCTERLRAFCGFYVAKADTKLFNKASHVVLVRDGDRTVLTMANDFKGDPKEFAIVVPVPTFLQRGQIHVAEKGVLDHLDAYTAPRLVEYFDENPCDRRMYEMSMQAAAPEARVARKMRRSAEALGVTIEASYTVGEYDILILSAAQSTGLETWLRQNGYRIPSGASEVLGSYIRQNMRFFVARVNLAEQSKLGFSSLRPIQVAYESPKFMLPIRLGMVNADGPQELFVYALTRKGRVEATNYRTVKLPSGMDLPVYVKNEFGPFYKAMFAEQTRREDMRAVFVEYAWDMNWCDPCAADPLSRDELKKLGVFWIDEDGSTPVPVGPRPRPMFPSPGGAQDAFVTRLHVRYDAAHFPEDLVFQETGDRANFQGRYVMRHPWMGGESCEAAKQYWSTLPDRYEREAQALASLTGWRIAEIRQKMNALPAAAKPQGAKTQPAKSWWDKLWGGQ
jgi:hypothetical protein